jgi:hypothetical protein
LIFVLFAFGGICGCATDPFIRKLQNDIDQAPYSTEDYVLGEFDCSNMANLLDDWLEQMGYDTKIMVYYPITNKLSALDGPITKPITSNLKNITPLKADNSALSGQPHAILLVNNHIIVESVTKKVLKNRRPQDYIGALIFQDAENLLNYLPVEEWLREWGYERFLYNKVDYINSASSAAP